jgi:hypothetical protein
MVAFKELGLISRAALLATLHTLLNGCNGAVCKEGTEDCPCTADDSCEAGLFCEERVCKVDDADRRKPPKTEDGEGAPGTGGSGASTGAEDDGSEEPDGSNTGGTGATAPGEDSAGGARDEEPDEDAGAAGSGNAGTGGSGGTDDDERGGSAGADASGGSTENGGSGGSAGSGADSGNGGSDNPGSGGSGGTNTGGTNAGGTGGGLAGSGGTTTEPVPFPVACWGCAIEGCAEPMNDCRNDGTCDACITTSYVQGLCEENAAYSELAECFCNNFCAARCTDVCE